MNLRLVRKILGRELVEQFMRTGRGRRGRSEEGKTDRDVSPPPSLRSPIARAREAGDAIPMLHQHLRSLESGEREMRIGAGGDGKNWQTLEVEGVEEKERSSGENAFFGEERRQKEEGVE